MAVCPFPKQFDPSPRGSTESANSTGVVVVQIGEIQYNGELYKIPANPIIKTIRDTMTGIQRGKIEHGDWSYVIPKWDGPAREHDVDGQETTAA